MTTSTKHTPRHDLIYGSRVSGRWGSAEVSSRHAGWTAAAVARINAHDELTAQLAELAAALRDYLDSDVAGHLSRAQARAALAKLG